MEVLEKVEKLHKESIKQFEDEFASIISVDNIVEIIKDKKYKRKTRHGKPCRIPK